MPSQEFQIWWQQVLRGFQDQIDGLTAALASAEEAKKSLARINSYTNPTDILTAYSLSTISVDSTLILADSILFKADATAYSSPAARIVIDPHERIYPHNSDITISPVDILGANIDGLAFSTVYYVYYDDSTLADTTPNFQTTVIPSEAQVGAASFRHFVGVVTTPASGGGSTDGSGGLPPGGGGGAIVDP